jgi:hypothetical protein
MFCRHGVSRSIYEEWRIGEEYEWPRTMTTVLRGASPETRPFDPVWTASRRPLLHAHLLDEKRRLARLCTSSHAGSRCTTGDKRKQDQRRRETRCGKRGPSQKLSAGQADDNYEEAGVKFGAV